MKRAIREAEALGRIEERRLTTWRITGGRLEWRSNALVALRHSIRERRLARDDEAGR